MRTIDDIPAEVVNQPDMRSETDFETTAELTN